MISKLKKLGWPVVFAGVLLLVYGPFFGFRFLRMAGDEKVYVSQAIEMAQRGNWFVQVLMGSPDYYKGPIHYLFLRIGMIIFGMNPWATLYMNLLMMFWGGWSLGSLISRRFPLWKGGPLWIAVFFALNVGIYTHSFTSQMETELASLFAVGLNLLDQVAIGQAGLGFWSVCGFIGLVKSPLHSVFAGTSALLFWGIQGELWKRLRRFKTWLGMFIGVAVCILGLMPAALLDWNNFYGIYFLRENVSKGGSGQHWTVSLYSTLGYYMFPWLFLAALAYLQAILQFPKWIKNAQIRRLVFLCLSWIAPSVCFFVWHDYHFENYNLPVISGVLLFVAVIWAQRSALWNRFYSVSIGLTGISFLILPIFISVLTHHFSPPQEWWPGWLEPLAWIGCLGSVFGLFRYGVFKLKPDERFLAVSLVGFYIGLGAFLTALGEREVLDLRKYLKEAKTRGDQFQITYFNLNHNIWSEWGFLNFWIDQPVQSAHNGEILKAALLRGDLIIVQPKEDFYEQFVAFCKKEVPQMEFEKTLWKRWRTRGQSPDGESLWGKAWEKRDLSILEMDYYLIRPKKPGNSPTS